MRVFKILDGGSRVRVNGVSPLADSVRELRAKQSQQAFATQLGLSISSIAHYEGGFRSPDIRTLLKFYAVARDSQRHDLAEYFADLVNKEVGSKVIG